MTRVKFFFVMAAAMLVHTNGYEWLGYIMWALIVLSIVVKLINVRRNW